MGGAKGGARYKLVVRKEVDQDAGGWTGKRFVSGLDAWCIVWERVVE